MVKGVTCLVIASLLAGAAMAGSAHAGKAPFVLKVAKHKDGPYKAEIKSNFEAGQTRSFWWRVRSLDTQDRGLTFADDGTSDQDGYKTRWFKAGENISEEVEGKGKEFILHAGQSKYFSAKQTALDAPEPTCLAGLASDGFTVAFAPVQINGAGCIF